jgi:hypothetical protein
VKYALERLWAQIDGIAGAIESRNWRGAKHDRNGNQRPRVVRSMRHYNRTKREGYGDVLAAEFAATALSRRTRSGKRRARERLERIVRRGAP